jgi:hypothetical protein
LAERLARRARGFALASPAWRLLLPQVLSENSGTLLRNLPGPPRVLSDVMSRLEPMPHEGALVFFGRGALLVQRIRAELTFHSEPLETMQDEPGTS